MSVSPVEIARSLAVLRETVMLGQGWEAGLDAFARAAGAGGGVLIAERADGAPSLVSSAGIAEATEDYRAGRTPPDPRSRRVNPPLARGFVGDFDYFDADELRRDDFYAGYLGPRGYFWHGCARVDGGGARDEVHLSLKRRREAGHYARSDLEILSSALVDLRALVTWNRGLSAATERGRVDLATHRGEALLELDDRGVVIGASPRGEEMLRHDLVAIGGRPRARNPGADESVLARAIDATMGRSPRAGLAVIEGAEPGRRVIARVLPVEGRARDVFGRTRSLVLLRVAERGGGDDTDRTARALVDVFGATPAEARVLALVAIGASPEAVAGRLGASIGTIRNHLKRGMAKLGLARQAELAAFVARLVI